MVFPPLLAAGAVVGAVVAAVVVAVVAAAVGLAAAVGAVVAAVVAGPDALIGCVAGPVVGAGGAGGLLHATRRPLAALAATNKLPNLRRRLRLMLASEGSFIVVVPLSILVSGE